MVERPGVYPASGLFGSRGSHDVSWPLSFSSGPGPSLLGGHGGTGQHKANLGPD